MGLRGELFSTRVILQNRTYFFNVKENRMGDLYLNIVESKNRDDGGFDRQSVILFADDLQEFLKGFDESLRIMEKEVRERKKQSRAAGAHDTARRDKPDGQQAERKTEHKTPRKPEYKAKRKTDRKTEHSEKPRGRPPREGGGREGGGRERKRVIVKKV